MEINYRDTGPDERSLQAQELQQEIASNIASGARFLRFAGGLETIFEAETGVQRGRFLALQGFAGLFLLNCFLIIDYIALPDVFWLGVVLRAGVVTPIGLAAMWLQSRNPAPFVREGLAAVLAPSGAVVILWLVLASASPARELYYLGIIPVMMFGMTVQRIRFWYALPMMAYTLALFVITIIAGGAGLIEQIGGASVMLSVAFFSAMSSYALEREERLSWLRSLNERLRSEQFEELATVDPMTGLGNRRAMQHWLDELADSQKDEAIAFILGDIDHFKSYNDTFGHMQGDDCIRRVSGVLASTASRFGGRAFRFGGEEFVVVLVGSGPERVYQAAEMLRQTILETHQPHKTAVSPYVTCSFGYAIDRLEEGFDVTALITEADFALYAAKSAGRNCVMPPGEEVQGDPMLETG